MHTQSFSLVPLLATPWNVSHWIPLSMGLSQQEYWSEMSFPSPGDLLGPGIKVVAPASLAL